MVTESFAAVFGRLWAGAGCRSGDRPCLTVGPAPRRRRLRPGRAVTLMWFALVAGPAVWVQPARGQGAFAALTDLLGKPVSVQLQDGTVLENVVVNALKKGAEPGTFRGLVVQCPRRLQTVWAAAVSEIYYDGKPLGLTYDKRTRTIAQDFQRREAAAAFDGAVAAHLGARGKQLWPPLDDAQRAAWVARHKAFLRQVGTEMAPLAFELVETEYFLFYTDIPAQRVALLVSYLDAMYLELAKAFRVTPGENIWCGKCVVVAFHSREAFQEFESRFMRDPNSDAQGTCHRGSDGSVIIAVWKGTYEGFFAHTLVHETAHGFVHRYRSNVPIPTWINEGIAEWVASRVVTGETEVARRQWEAVRRLRTTPKLGISFFANGADLEAWQYGAACSLLELLQRTDAAKYRLFLRGIKDGLTQEQSLQQAYGMTLLELLGGYGRSIGVPGLSL